MNDLPDEEIDYEAECKALEDEAYFLRWWPSLEDAINLFLQARALEAPLPEPLLEFLERMFKGGYGIHISQSEFTHDRWEDCLLHEISKMRALGISTNDASAMIAGLLATPKWRSRWPDEPVLGESAVRARYYKRPKFERNYYLEYYRRAFHGLSDKQLERTARYILAPIPHNFIPPHLRRRFAFCLDTKSMISAV